MLVHLGGLITVTPTVPLKTRDDLSMAYTPGGARVCQAIAACPAAGRSLTIKQNGVFRHECGEFHGKDQGVLVVGQRLSVRPVRPAIRTRFPFGLGEPTVGSLEEPSTWHARVVPRFGVSSPTEPRRPIPCESPLHSSA